MNALVKSLPLLAVLCLLPMSSAETPAQEPALAAELIQRAEQGDAAAQARLGYAYMRGEGVEKDMARAVVWWQKAAEQGDARAQMNLALAYSRGEGVEHDDAKAVEWWSKAAEQGVPRAQVLLGYALYKGKGVAQDKAEARRLWRLAAAAGDEKAKQLSGSLGVEWRWYNVLAVLFMVGAAVCMWRDWRRLSRLKRGAAAGDVQAQFQLASYYRAKGKDKPMMKWMLAAAEQGLPEAQLAVALACRDGRGVQQSSAEYIRWLKSAADQGEDFPLVLLAQEYLSGEHVQKDAPEGLRLLHKAIDSGSADAVAVLGVCYGVGNGVEADEAQAMSLLRKAADMGSAPAQCRLGMLLLHEADQSGDEEELHAAVHWLRAAADQGDEEALNALRQLRKLKLIK